jgi:hypothetical protein
VAGDDTARAAGVNVAALTNVREAIPETAPPDSGWFQNPRFPGRRRTKNIVAVLSTRELDPQWHRTTRTPAPPQVSGTDGKKGVGDHGSPAF